MSGLEDEVIKFEGKEVEDSKLYGIELDRSLAYGKNAGNEIRKYTIYIEDVDVICRLVRNEISEVTVKHSRTVDGEPTEFTHEIKGQNTDAYVEVEMESGLRHAELHFEREVEA